MIHLARSIEEAWRRTISETASLSGEVSELASLSAEVRLDAEMGDMALSMLGRVLAGEFDGFPAWERDGQGNFCRELDGGVVLVYDPKKALLHVQTQLTSTVSATASGTAEICGTTVGELAVTAVSRYYDDGWGGRREEDARQEAYLQAERRLASAVASLHQHQQAEAVAAAEIQAQEAAGEKAAGELERLKAEARDALREQLQSRLAQAEEQVHQVMNRAVGEAYRQTLRQLVLDNGGRIVTDEQTGSVISMELELY